MERLLRWLDPAARPVLVQLPDAEYRARAAEWGLPEPRPRARDLGLAPGVFPPGPLNAITDVAGRARRPGDARRGRHASAPGVTAVLPHGGNLFQEKVPGAVFVGNAFGKLAGSTQVRELGTIETPIVLTNTLAVGTAVEAVVGWTLAAARQRGRALGERRRGRDERRRALNDIRSLPVRREHVRRGDPVRDRRARSRRARSARARARWPSAGRAASARRRGVLPERFGGHTLGVLVQANFGGVLTMDGVPVGRELGRYAFASRSTPRPTPHAPGIAPTAPA